MLDLPVSGIADIIGRLSETKPRPASSQGQMNDACILRYAEQCQSVLFFQPGETVVSSGWLLLTFVTTDDTVLVNLCPQMSDQGLVVLIACIM